MVRRPPRSTRTDTLLPSTTLYRSARSEISENCAGSQQRWRFPLRVSLRSRPGAGAWSHLKIGHPRTRLAHRELPYIQALVNEARRSIFQDDLVGPACASYVARDRKSTRLNTSN